MDEIDPDLIEAMDVYHDFAIDFMSRWNASLAIARAIKILGAHAANDDDLSVVTADLQVKLDKLTWLDTDPRAPRTRGEHRGQRQGALCRRLLVLSIHAAAGAKPGAIGDLLLRHDIDLDRWRGWQKLTPAEERAEAKRSGRLPARYGIRSAVPEKLWGLYATHIADLSGRGRNK